MGDFNGDGKPDLVATGMYSNANVFFLGRTSGYVGLAQANITIPSLPSGSYPLVVTIDGAPRNGPLVTRCRYSLVQPAGQRRHPDRGQTLRL